MFTSQLPPHSGSDYFSYKKTFSIVLMAVVDANYKFVMVDVGAPGRHSDGGVFKASEFGRQLGNETLDIPKLSRLPNSTKVAPYVYVGDEAFQLRPDFMRPFPGKSMLPCHSVQLPAEQSKADCGKCFRHSDSQVEDSAPSCGPAASPCRICCSCVLHTPQLSLCCTGGHLQSTGVCRLQ